MGITVDDVVSKEPIAGETGITTTYFEGRIDSQTRVLTLNFSQKKIAVLDDGHTFEDPIHEEIRVILSDPLRSIPLLNRKTSAPTGNDITAGKLTQALNSLFIAERTAIENLKAQIGQQELSVTSGHDV